MRLFDTAGNRLYLNAEEREAFLAVARKRPPDERTFAETLILTSNRAFKEWGEIFGDNVIAAALLDRLLHHAVVIKIEGNSYRLRAHQDLMPENLLRPHNTDQQTKRKPGRPRKENA